MRSATEARISAQIIRVKRSPGLFGQALEFDGEVGQGLLVGIVDEDFSICFWMRPDANGAVGKWFEGTGLVGNNTEESSEDFGVSLVGNRVVFGVGEGAEGRTVMARTPIAPGKWIHVAATRNAFTGRMCLYINGRLQGTKAGPKGVLQDSRLMQFGRFRTNTKTFDGMLDEIRIYGEELSAVQVKSLFSLKPGAAPRVPPDRHKPKRRRTK